MHVGILCLLEICESFALHDRNLEGRICRKGRDAHVLVVEVWLEVQVSGAERLAIVVRGG